VEPVDIISLWPKNISPALLLPERSDPLQHCNLTSNNIAMQLPANRLQYCSSVSLLSAIVQQCKSLYVRYDCRRIYYKGLLMCISGPVHLPLVCSGWRMVLLTLAHCCCKSLTWHNVTYVLACAECNWRQSNFCLCCGVQATWKPEYVDTPRFL